MIVTSMKTVSQPTLSSLVRDQINRPSPIRQIMKMAERQNILAMGLDPAQVRAHAPQMATDALASGSPANNPRVPTHAEIVSLYEQAM